MNKRLLALFLPMVFAACQQQHIVNSPCAIANSSFDIKPRIDMSFVFGNDAIKAAIDAVKGGLSQLSVPELSKSGTDAAVRTATVNGKHPTANDVSALQKYLSNDIVPAMKQNPTCNFTVTSLGRPYIAIEHVMFRDIGGQRTPVIAVKNTGQAEATVHIWVQYLLDGLEKSHTETDLRLGPSQDRASFPSAHNLPILDIEAGKTKLRIVIVMSYPVESGAPPVSHQETWEYNSQVKLFTISS